MVAEVTARRLGSPLDSLLRLTNAAGKELAVNDDFEDKAAALLTHHADSRIRIKLPAAGAFYLYLSDTQGSGGPDYGYRLRVSRPQPDFDLRVTPASINARAGATIPVTVYALRRDDFSGEITLAQGRSRWLTSGASIPANTNEVRLTLTVPSRPEPPQFSRSKAAPPSTAGSPPRRRPAEDMMQAFYYHHLVASHEWLAQVTGQPRPNARAAWKVESKRPCGSHPVAPPACTSPSPPRLADILRLELNAPPEGVTIKDVETVRDESPSSSPSTRGQAGTEGQPDRRCVHGTRRPNAPSPPAAVPLGTLPAIPFEIVAPGSAALVTRFSESPRPAIRSCSRRP